MLSCCQTAPQSPVSRSTQLTMTAAPSPGGVPRSSVIVAPLGCRAHPVGDPWRRVAERSGWPPSLSRWIVADEPKEYRRPGYAEEW